MAWKFELLARYQMPLTEGPVWDGEFLYYTHIQAHRIMRYDPKSGAVSEWRTETNFTNGLGMTLGAQGNIVATAGWAMYP